LSWLYLVSVPFDGMVVFVLQDRSDLMRSLRSGLAVLVILLSALPAFAGPITGAPTSADPAASASEPAAGGAMDTSFSSGSLFDPVGAPLLRTSAPIYLMPGHRDKLRGGGSGFGGDYGGGYSSGGPAMGVTGGATTVANLTFEVPLGSDPSALPFSPLAPIPEPATLALLATAAAFAVRRRRPREVR
jgi:hypothetical protein